MDEACPICGFPIDTAPGFHAVFCSTPPLDSPAATRREEIAAIIWRLGNGYHLPGECLGRRIRYWPSTRRDVVDDLVRWSNHALRKAIEGGLLSRKVKR